MMSGLQQVVVFAVGLMGLATFAKGALETYSRKNAYGLAGWMHVLGAFVWGDALVFGLFWLFVTGLVFLLRDWYLFLFIVSLFWLVRSVGEVWYWLLQQFSSKLREKPKDSILYPIYRSEAVWFGHQIIWQCALVLSIVTSVYTGIMWIGTL